MKFPTAAGMAGLLLVLLLFTSLGASADHGPTRTSSYLQGAASNCLWLQCPTDAGEVVAAVEDDSEFEQPVVGEDYSVPVSILHVQVASFWSDVFFPLGDVFLHGDNHLDGDNDGYSDDTEIFCDSNPLNPASTCEDRDADGLVDIDNDGSEEYNGQEVNTSPTNADSDDDGYSDKEEVIAQGPNAPYDPLDPASNPGVDRDEDGDGVADYYDSCPSVANPQQEDSDRDGVGDACEGPLGPILPGNGCDLRQGTITMGPTVCGVTAIAGAWVPSEAYVGALCDFYLGAEPCDSLSAYIIGQFENCHAYDLPVGACHSSGFGTGWIVRIGDNYYAV